MPIYTSSFVLDDTPTGAKGQTYSRRQATSIQTITSGRMVMSVCPISAGSVVTSVTFYSSTTALSTPSHGWGALYTPAGDLLAQSANDTGITWAANSAKTFTLTAPQAITADGWYYLAVMVAATTPPTLVAMNPANAGVVVASLAPVLGGSYNTGLTTTAPSAASNFSAAPTPYGTWS